MKLQFFVGGILLAIAWCPGALAQGVITTYAGSDWVFTGGGQPALNAPLGMLTGITLDPSGNPVFVDSGNCIVARINQDATLSVLAGTGCFVFASGDGGLATAASLLYPNSVTFDGQGNLYVTGLNDVRKITPQGIITTVATASQGQLYGATGIAVDASGVVYFADLYDNRVRKITSAGVVTVAGQDNGAGGFSGDGGPGIKAQLNQPRGLAIDKAGNLYIADTGNNRVRKVDGNGVITTVVPNLSAYSICFDTSGNLIIGAIAIIYKVSPGSNVPVAVPGGPFAGPLVASGPQGDLYIADGGNFRVRHLSATGVLTTLAGNGQFRAPVNGAPALSAVLDTPLGLALHSNGEVYFTQQNQVLKITQGVLTIVAGTGQAGYSGDGGPAAKATLRAPIGLVLDPSGNVFVADQANSSIRRITASGTISTVAALPSSPIGLAMDPAGNLYASSAARVYLIDSTGHVSPYAGTGTSGYSGDGGPALNAMLRQPRGVVFDNAGNLYIADGQDNRVRRVDRGGTISTFAGNGTPRYAGDGGPASSASLRLPSFLAIDKTGNLYISDDNNFVIRKVSPAGIISTFAGGGAYDQISDGKLATSATLYSPAGVAADSSGNIYIADAGRGSFGNRIREVLVTPPTMQVSPGNLSLAANSGGLPVKQRLVVTGSIAGLDFNVTVDTHSSGAWLAPDAGPYSTPRLLTLTADPTNLAPGSYSATVTISPVAAVPAVLVVNLTFSVGAAQPPALAIDKQSLSFTLPQGVNTRTSTLLISNAGGQSLHYTATGATNSGGNWLALSPASGQATAAGPSTLVVTVTQGSLGPGTYTGRISIVSTAGNQTVPVIMTVSNKPATVLLTQTGLSFTAVAQGGVIPPQSFGVLNVGTGGMDWTASTSTTDGINWLAVSPGSGSADASQPATQAEISVNAAGLAPGYYYGSVFIDAPGAANQSRVITVSLNVLPPATPTAVAVQPAELLFNTAPGAEPPGAQTLDLYNVTATPRKFVSARSSGSFEIFLLPDKGTLDPTQPMSVVVQPYTGNFPSGKSAGTITFEFDDGTIQSVPVTVISAPTPASAARNGPVHPDASAGCTPSSLAMVSNALGQAFQVNAGWKIGLNLTVTDDCNNPVVGHPGDRVWARFSDGEDDLDMVSLGDGTWQQSWKPLNQNTPITITARAQSGALTGQKDIGGGVGAANIQPQFTLNSIEAVFDEATGVRALAPGTFISIYGAGLAGSVAQASAPSSQLAGTQVFFGRTPAPVQFVSPGQVNVLVPWETTPDLLTQQIRVQNGTQLSDPVAVDLAATEPSMFQTATASGGQVVYALDYPASGGSPFVVTPAAPASANDTLVFYCVGLGGTDQHLADGGISPSFPPANVAGLTMSIGGQNATVSFAGLVPGFVGLYQINAVMPAGVTTGNAVAVAISVGGQTSPVTNISAK